MPQPKTEPRIVQATLRFRNSILNAERQASTRLVNAYGAIYQRLQDKIRALEMDIAELGANPTRGQITRLTRYNELLQQTADEMDKYAIILENELSLLRNKAIDNATAQAKQLVQFALPAMPESAKAQLVARFNRLPRAAIIEMLGALQDGSPLTDLLNEFGSVASGQIGDAITQGVALGYNPRKVAQQIRDALGGNLTRALLISRTETLRAYRGASLANYRANADVVKGWTWTSAKDSRVCLACLALDGRDFGLDKTYVPAHPNCRCAPRPKTASYRDMGLNVDEPPSDYQTAGEWFAQQPDATKREMLGAKAYEHYQRGEIQLTDFIGLQKSRAWGDAYVQKSLKEILGNRK